jgi:ParB family chromosome partitioning protein
MPATLIRDLTAQKTAAIAAGLARQPEVALAAVAHALALRAFFNGSPQTSLKITAAIPTLAASIAHPDDCQGFAVLTAEHETWSDELPDDPDDLWNWCLAQPQDTLLRLLAVCAALTVDAVQVKDIRPDAARLRHGDRLTEALKLDMTTWFTPTAANYFGRISRARILDALSEAQGKVPLRSVSELKKPALAAHAEREVAGTRWLPRPLLPIDDNAQADNDETEMLADAAA